MSHLITQEIIHKGQKNSKKVLIVMTFKLIQMHYKQIQRLQLSS